MVRNIFSKLVAMFVLMVMVCPLRAAEAETDGSQEQQQFSFHRFHYPILNY